MLATGSLKSPSGDCEPVTIGGVYKQNSFLGDSNYVVVRVHFTSPGRYKIATDIQNGFSFQDSAVVIDTGYQSIKLKGSGKPLLAQTTNFLVAFNTSYCSFSVSFDNSTAVFSLAGSPNTCSNFSLEGSYMVGTSLSTSNKIRLEVNVNTIGSYSITTNTTNGIAFSGTGNFTTTGNQTLTLQGTGTPLTGGITTIPIIAGNSNCNFNINVTNNAASINRADSAWEFKQGTRFFHGYFDGALTTPVNGSTVLTLVGLTGTDDTAIAILANIEGPVVKTGSYKTLTASTFEFFDYTGKSIFTARAATTTVEMTVVITAYNPATQIIEGTFSGTALNESNQPAPITAGKFKAKLNG